MWSGFLRAALVGALLPAGAHAQSAPPTNAAGYALFALEDVAVRAHARIDPGNVGANQGTVRLGTGVRVTGTVAGGTIRVAQGVRVDSLFCSLIRGPRRFACGAVSMPLVDGATLGLVQVLPGSADVSVPPHARTAPLAPAGYGTARVGTRGVLELGGGTYAFRSIALARRSSLLCAGPCRILVADRVRVASGATIGRAVGGGGGGVRIEIQTGGGRPAFRTAGGAMVAGTVYAPAAPVGLGAHGTFEGTFIGRTVTVGAGARVKGPGSN